MYKLVSNKTVLKYKSFNRATSKLLELGIGKIYSNRVLVGEL